MICPADGLGSVSGLLEASAKVVAWAGAGPLYWAAGQSAAGDNTSALASPIISVSFVDSGDGSAISVSGLLQSFIVNMSVSDGANESTDVKCVHWNTSGLGSWVEDGM